jgi:hypothetical protein
VPPSIPFSLASSPWKDLCDRGANEAVTGLEKYCKANPGVPEHSRMTNDTCNELQKSLMQQFDKQMRQSWNKSIQPRTAYRTNCPDPEVGIVRIKDPRTGIVSTNLGATIEMGVEQVSQEPNQSPDTYRFIANAAAKVGPDGSIVYTNCYSLRLKQDRNTGFFQPLKDPPIGQPGSSTAPPTTLESKA